MKKIISLLLTFAMLVSTVYLLSVGASAAGKITLNVYNWGEYIDLNVIPMFEKEHPNIKVNYTTFDSNESMYSKIVSGAASYDIVIPSDYMIAKLIQEDMLAEINFDNIPNYKYIDDTFKNQLHDPTDKYSVPYLWGTVVILYNTQFVSEDDIAEESIELLWNEKYAGKILMFDNPRDAFGLALKSLGYSLNSTNEDEWKEAAKKLKAQKPLVQAYVMDAIFDKMEVGEAWIAPYYAGDAIIIHEENEYVDAYMPKEGTNLFFDSMCILNTTTHKEEAEAFINFMCDPEIAAMNSEEVGYATPNTGAMEILGEEVTGDELIYPTRETLEANTEVFINLPQNIQLLQSVLWTDLKIQSSEDPDNVQSAITWIDWFCIATVVIGAFAGGYFAIRNSRRKKLWKSK